ncbi:MAG: UDP-N-acetylenolpyruvoylglucosamine reductase, partial [Ruminococcus sp.]|nr:UDP-N-acetylenolpyruvoylglucosamine reductase [Ruminococcus sp.]
FIINKNNSTSADILALISEVQKNVLEKKGVKLEPEVRLIPYEE